MRLVTLVAVFAALTACGSPPTAESCAEICGASSGGGSAPAAAPAPEGKAQMTSFEHDLLSPLITDIREGVRPFNEQGVGLCKGTERCEAYLGMSAPDLPPGEYILQAELRVPKTGAKGTWKVTVDYDCTYEKTSDNGTTSSSKTSSRDYEVVYAGENRGYRLVPLRKFESPHKGSSEKCNWKITAPHPDGDTVWEGSWFAPAEE